MAGDQVFLSFQFLSAWEHSVWPDSTSALSLPFWPPCLRKLNKVNEEWKNLPGSLFLVLLHEGFFLIRLSCEDSPGSSSFPVEVLPSIQSACLPAPYSLLLAQKPRTPLQSRREVRCQIPASLQVPSTLRPL